MRHVLALALFSSSIALSQPCQVTSGPYQFLPTSQPPPSPIFSNGGFATSLAVMGQSILVSENRGYTRFSLANAANPALQERRDIVNDVGLSGDGTSFVTALSGTVDGQRAVVGWEQQPYGGIILRGGSGLPYGGDFGDESASAITVAEYGQGRYLGLLLNANGVYASDLTTTTSGTPPQPDSHPYGKVPGTPTSNFSANLAAASGLVFYAHSQTLQSLDARNPSWGSGAGIANSIYALPSRSAVSLGFASGSTLKSATAVTMNGQVYLFVEGSSSGASRGVRVFRIDPTSPTVYNPIGAWTPPTGQNQTNFGSSALVMAGDAYWFGWHHNGLGLQRLAILAASKTADGNLVNFTVDRQAVPKFAGIQSQAVTAGPYLYAATAEGAFSFAISCGSGPIPTATPTIAPTSTVTPTPSPGPPGPTPTPTSTPVGPLLYLRHPDGRVDICRGLGCTVTLQ